MQFRGYEILSLLYDGPGSHVHRARRESDDAAVILKVLRPALPSPERLAAFKREYETLNSLSGSGVIKAYGLESDRRSWVLVQEDIGGRSLDQFIGEAELSLTTRVELAIAIVEALDQVHARHVIHKDINPSNIIWNPDTRELKIIDFGISTTLTREHPTIRHPNQLVGTLAYIAPEQTGRMNREIDYRTDFYTLGVTLYQLFSGELPFAASDPMELVHRHIAQLPKPLSEVDAAIPSMLSGVVAKLMAKMAEERYQSSYGIKRDLQACLALLRGEATESELTLSRDDVSEVFQLPQKLYGRDAEIATLLGLFERIDDRPQLALIKGYSGIGKSRLVNELQISITGRRGAFAAGKFDQLQRGTPYVAIAAAFRGLVHQLLGERGESLEKWKGALVEALDGDGQVIIDLVPEVELIIGPQPAVAELNPSETQGRLNKAFQAFVGVFAQPEHPLVLFLDDLQWAGPESLNLIELLFANESAAHLLLIGAYRDNEVDEAHPLMLSIAKLEGQGAAIEAIKVGPLGEAEVRELVADALHVSAEQVAPLAELVYAKTEGNPFFVTQLLSEVHDEGLVVFDREAGRWTWTLADIEATAVTTNVVELMIAKLRRQPEGTQGILRAASCLGNRFALETLAVIADLSPDEAYAQLLPAVREGLVLPASEPELALAVEPGAPLAAREYRFLHDRVQQAAYMLMDVETRKRVHLRAGRLLLRNTSEDQRREAVFDIVDQLNHGRELVEAQERVEIARLNSWAGQRAKSAAAYPAMREYLACAHELLGAGSGEREYDLTFEVYRDLSEAESLLGNPERADALARELLELAATPRERASVYMMIINQRTMVAAYKEALTACREGLAELDITMPVEALDAALDVESEAINERLGERSIPSLYDLHEVEDPGARQAMRLLVNAIPAAFYVDHAAHGWIVYKMVNLTLEFGLSPEASDLFAFYGHRLVWPRYRQFEAALQWATLAVRLSERFSSPGDKCRSCFILADWVMVWRRPIRETHHYMDEGYKAGLAAGEVLFNGYILFYKVFYPFYEGTPLARVLADVPAFLQYNERSKNQLGIDFFLGFRRAVGMLTETEAEPTGEDDFVGQMRENQSFMALCYYHIVRAQAHLILGEPVKGLAEADLAEALIPNIAGNLANAEHNLYTSLCIAALMREAEGERRAELSERLAGYEAMMRDWAANSPENFVHMELLVSAERARAEGRELEAFERYDRAIEDATDNGFVHAAALGNELAGRAWLARGRTRVGMSYMVDALYGYSDWGAEKKVERLRAEFPEFGALDDERGHPRALITSTSSSQSKGVLDLSSVFKASRAISGEIVLDQLMATLVETVIENAGARRGVLMLDRDGDLWVNVDAGVRDDGTQESVMSTEAPLRLRGHGKLPEQVIHYARRTLEPVIIHDASTDPRFASDPYIVGNECKSILAMPVLGQGKLLGVFYLENDLTTGAFTPSHIEVLELLASQAGISLENAQLFREMEQRVAARTLELRQKNADLEQVLLELRTAQAQLIHAEKMASLGRLSTGIAHEIKNPLNFIVNFAEVSVEIIDELREDGDSTAGAQLSEALTELREYNQHILHHSKRADGIVGGLTEHAVSPTDERRAVDFNKLVDQYVTLTHKDIQTVMRTTIELAREYDAEVGEVALHPQQMARVLVNLLNNAFDAILERAKSEPEGTFSPRVRVSTRLGSGVAEVHIADNGPGVSEEISGRIFEPFFTTKPPGMGTGLGLAICHDVVVVGHAGSVEVQRDAALGGAKFIIRLPI